MKRPRATNTRSLLLVMAICAAGTAVGILEVSTMQTTMMLRRAVHNELRDNRKLVEKRELLESQVWTLKASPRVAMRATEMLGMHTPRRDQRVVVGDRNP